jgi:hypothetical protein
MPNFAAKYSSDYLAADQMAAALSALPAVLHHLFGECTLTAYYGWGANLHNALCYVPMNVQTDAMPFFIEDSVNQRIIVPGQSDLSIDSPHKELRLLFCHESDIHVDGESLDFMHRFMDAEPFSKIRFYSQAELKALPPDHHFDLPSSPPKES